MDPQEDVHLEAFILLCGAMSMIIGLLWFASGITQRCGHVPGLANSLPNLGHMDKLLLVSHLDQSDLGYYFFGEPVTRWLAAKVAYILSIMLVYIVRQIVSS